MEKNLNQTSPLLLAYIGDAVYELKVREHLLLSGEVKMSRLHEKAVALVRADRQSQLAADIENLLTDEEKDVFRHGRNAKAGHHPNNTKVCDYRRATGVEALIGYLYLQGEEKKLSQIFEVLFSHPE